MIGRAGICTFALFLAVLAGQAEAQQRWRIESVTTILGTQRGTATSIAVGPGGIPHIAFLDLPGNGGSLVYVVREAEGWRHEFFANRYADGSDVAIKLDANGRPRLAWTDPEFSGRVIPRVQVAENLAGNWAVEEITSRLPFAMSMDLVKNLEPFIAYADYWDLQAMHVAHRRDGQWMINKVTNNAVSATATAVDPSGDAVHVVYVDVTHRAVKYARLSAGQWQFETVEALGPTADLLSTPSIALDNYGRLVAAYAFDGRMRVARRIDGVWQIEFVPEEGDAASPVVRVDRRNNLHVAYAKLIPTPPFFQVRYARTRAGVWELETVEEGAPAYGRLSFVLDRGGSAHIAYLFHDGARELRYATNRLLSELPASE